MFRERRVVDDRVFLLGLDELYRSAMMSHEVSELLGAARAVARELGIPPGEGPVEGYYATDPRLTEYFHLMRALQATEEALRPRVQGLPEFRRLEEVTSSPIYGERKDLGFLLPVGRDPLSQALKDAAPSLWAVGTLVEQAHRVAVEGDDFSLVGLAALIRDPVILTATRESVVLYAEMMLGAALRPRPPKYVWAVDRELARQAARFVDTFNSLFLEDLPSPTPENAETYWHASEDNQVIGRCVRLGLDDSRVPVRHYHWAIGRRANGRAEVEEFWDEEIWTTERYREELGRGDRWP